MKKINTILLLAVLSSPIIANAESIAAPKLVQGDTWTYIDTVETAPNGWVQTHNELVVDRATAEHVYFETKQAGASQPARQVVVGDDWSRARNVNGTETVVNRPLSFPLSVGKTWEVKYTEAHPNAQHDSETVDAHYKVVGSETVQVPAGKFDAIKIEAEGQWSAMTAPVHSASAGAVANETGSTVLLKTQNAQGKAVSGRLYKAFWYVPEIGRWVKSDEEYYNANDIRTQRVTSELESFKRAAQPNPS